MADATKTPEQTFYQRHLLAEALCGHSLWRDIQHASGELPGPIVFKDELRALRSQLGKSHEDQWIERLTSLGVQALVVDFTGADLREANLSRANLTLASMGAAILAGANLEEATLTSAKMAAANLRGANLRGADLTGADLRGADLTGADLFRAVLYDTDFSGAVMPNGVRFRDPDDDVSDEIAMTYSRP